MIRGTNYVFWKKILLLKYFFFKYPYLLLINSEKLVVAVENFIENHRKFYDLMSNAKNIGNFREFFLKFA